MWTEILFFFNFFDLSELKPGRSNCQNSNRFGWIVPFLLWKIFLSNSYCREHRTFYSFLENFIELLLILDVTDRWTFSIRINLQSVTNFFVNSLLIAKTSIMSLSAGNTENVKSSLTYELKFFGPTFLNSLNWDPDVQTFKVLTRLFNLLPLSESSNQSSLCRSCRNSPQFRRVLTVVLKWQPFLNTRIKTPYIEFFVCNRSFQIVVI